MEALTPFITYLNKFIELTEDEFQQHLAPYIQIRNFARKEIITKAGEVENYFNFILQGLVRKFYRRNKDEVITQLSYEGHIILAEDSFYSRTPSEYILEAVEPVKLISISYEDLEHIFSQSQKMEHLGRLVTTQTLMLRNDWQVQLLKFGPRERFLHFIEKNTTLLQRVPQKYLASYLHIKPETFSRFKHLLRTPSRNKLQLD